MQVQESTVPKDSLEERELQRTVDRYHKISIPEELNHSLCEHLASSVELGRAPGRSIAPSNIWLSISWYQEDACGLPAFAKLQSEARASRVISDTRLADVPLSDAFAELISSKGIYSVNQANANNSYFLELHADGRVFQIYQSILGSNLLLKLTPDQMQSLDERLTDQLSELISQRSTPVEKHSFAHRG